MITIKLYHPTDPRYLLLPDGFPLPKRITPEEAFEGKYGKLLLFAPERIDHIYQQPDGPGTDWLKPTPPASSEPTLPQFQS